MRLAKRSVTLGLVSVAVLAAGLLALPGSALAADGDKPDYELGLYLWGASIATDIDTSEFDASSHISFSDLLSNLNVAAMARARMNYDKFSVVFDGEYLDLESDTESKTVNVGPGPGVPITANAKAKLLAYILELNTGYQVFDVSGPFSAGKSDTRGTRGELYLGGRYYSMKPEVRLKGAVGRTIDAGEWIDFVDAVVGARLFIDLSKTVVLGIQGDMGGFSIGNSSDQSWEQITSLSWHFSDSMTMSLGYKFLDVRKDTGNDATVKIQIRGPFLAATYGF